MAPARWQARPRPVVFGNAVTRDPDTTAYRRQVFVNAPGDELGGLEG